MADLNGWIGPGLVSQDLGHWSRIVASEAAGISVDAGDLITDTEVPTFRVI